jgi:23S rRNA (uracil1939-C5)-methyltransferase
VKTLEEFQVEIDSLDQEGRGVGRREGKAVFVEGALPGERVRYERRRNKPNYEVGRAIAIERTSPLRTNPRCPHFGLAPGACGGCSLQHVDAHAQISIKQRVLEDTLWHIGRLRAETILRPLQGPDWRYRYRARLAVRHVAKKGGVLVGFHERSSSYVADMQRCEVLPKRISDLLLPLRALISQLSLRDRLPQIELAAAHTAGGTQFVLVLRVLQPPTADDRTLLESFAREHGVEFWLQPDALQLALPEFGVHLPFQPTDFTQVNHEVNAALVSRAIRLLEPSPTETVVDFFCGLGNFTLPIARKAACVVGYEGSAALIARAQAAAASNGLQQRTEFRARNLFEWSATDWQAAVADCRRIHKVLIDPPREGALEVARSLAQTTDRPDRIVYVSCNPATLARDCAVLVHDGGWMLKSAGVVNMFPHTSHVESIAVIEAPA